MSAASPEFYQPCAPPAYSPGRVRVAATEPSANGEDYRCRTPTGVISYLGEPVSCPPAPMKPREPPASACRRRLFDVKVIKLRFDDLQAIDRPSFLRNGKRRPSRIY